MTSSAMRIWQQVKGVAEFKETVQPALSGQYTRAQME